MAESSSADSCGLGGSARPTTRQAGGSKSREPSPRFSSGLQRHTTTISRKRAGRASRRRCSSRRRWSPTGSPACSRERWGRFRYTREYGPDGYGCGRQEARRWWGAIQGQKPVGIRQRRCLWRPATPGADPGRTEVLAAVWSPAQSVRGLQGRPRRSCVRSPRRRRSRARPHHGRSPCRQGAGWPGRFYSFLAWAPRRYRTWAVVINVAEARAVLVLPEWHPGHPVPFPARLLPRDARRAEAWLTLRADLSVPAAGQLNLSDLSGCPDPGIVRCPRPTWEPTQ